MQMRSLSGWSTHAVSGAVRSANLQGLTFPLSQFNTRCNINTLLHISRFLSCFCPQYLVTKSVPEVQALKREIPVLRHLDGSFYLRCLLSKLFHMCVRIATSISMQLKATHATNKHKLNCLIMERSHFPRRRSHSQHVNTQARERRPADWPLREWTRYGIARSWSYFDNICINVSMYQYINTPYYIILIIYWLVPTRVNTLW